MIIFSFLSNFEDVVLSIFEPTGLSPGDLGSRPGDSNQRVKKGGTNALNIKLWVIPMIARGA